jgi:hypothetical protein
MIAWSRLVIGGFLAAGLAVSGVVAAQAPLCTVTSGIVQLPGVGEASGVAVSRRTPGIIWSHNDSGQPSLFAFDRSGNARGRVQVTGVSITDWEDLAAGPCREPGRSDNGDPGSGIRDPAGGSCLYIADIGDNHRMRRNIVVHRVPEPGPGDTAAAPAETWVVAYPDGPRDAEALFMTHTGALYLVSKDHAGLTALYRVPMPPAGNIGMLEYVARLPLERVTGADASPDGSGVALRTNTELLFYRTDELLAGKPTQPRRFDLRPLAEPQGEGVAFGADGLIYLVGEGGRSGTLATLRCSLR